MLCPRSVPPQESQAREDLAARAAALEADLKATRQRLEDATASHAAELANAHADASAASARASALRAEVEQQQAELRDKDARLSDVRSGGSRKLAELQVAHQARIEEVAAEHREALARKQARIDDLQHQVHGLQDTLGGAKTETSAIVRNLTSARDEAARELKAALRRERAAQAAADAAAEREAAARATAARARSVAASQLFQQRGLRWRGGVLQAWRAVVVRRRLARRVLRRMVGRPQVHVLHAPFHKWRRFSMLSPTPVERELASMLDVRLVGGLLCVGCCGEAVLDASVLLTHHACRAFVCAVCAVCGCVMWLPTSSLVVVVAIVCCCCYCCVPHPRSGHGDTAARHDQRQR